MHGFRNRARIALSALVACTACSALQCGKSNPEDLASTDVTFLLGVGPSCADRVQAIHLELRTESLLDHQADFPIAGISDLPVVHRVTLPPQPGTIHEAEALFEVTTPEGSQTSPLRTNFASGTRGRVSLSLPCVCLGHSCSDGETCVELPPGSGNASCVATSECGDGACELMESAESCPADCIVGCGDGICAKETESCVSCPRDCGSCCGNGICDPDETCGGCPDCSPCCGDGSPDPGEQCDDGNAVDCDVCEGCEVRSHLVFKGVDDSYVEVPHANPLRLLDTSFTVEAWFRLAPDERVHISKRGNHNNGWRLVVRNDRVTATVFMDEGTADQDFAHTKGTEVFADDGWHHVAWTFTGSRVSRIYIDGLLEARAATSPVSVADSGRPLVIGASVDETGRVRSSHPGSIDELRISRVVRYVRKDAPFIPPRRFDPDADTAGLWHADEGTGGIVSDASSAAVHGTIVESGVEWGASGTYGGRFCSGGVPSSAAP